PCGEYAKTGEGNCPLNVCCSQFGFCGTTSEFYGTGCQDGYGSCGDVNRPKCSGTSAENGRRIGYYESWADDSNSRLCNRRTPDEIPLVGLTHLNFAFTFFGPTTFEISPMSSAAAGLYKSFTALKKKSPGPETWISLGGWTINDEGNTPNTRTAFSDMASTSANRRKFIEHLQNFMQSYGFDGIDIDWEYPAADDRGGSSADTDNFVRLLKEMRSSWGTSYGISVTLPSSYWYLQVMTFMVSGILKKQYTDPIIRPHTNLTEIREGLDLMWMAGFEPSKVVLGLGWYGRSFTLVNPSCSKPNGVCEFSGGGNPGSCTNSAGEIRVAKPRSAATRINSKDASAARTSAAVRKTNLWKCWLGGGRSRLIYYHAQERKATEYAKPEV
ncbi:class V chitinase, partial [Penicillium waksmanii]|uniref:class V chitinase n=1 Tax=Penicillium waksmanii TaxID=69791 RepID=UPI0025468088